MRNKYVENFIVMIIISIVLSISFFSTKISIKRENREMSDFLSSISETDSYHLISSNKLEIYSDNEFVCEELYGNQLRSNINFGENIRYCIIQVQDDFLIPDNIQISGDVIVVINSKYNHNYKIFIGKNN